MLISPIFLESNEDNEEKNVSKNGISLDSFFCVTRVSKPLKCLFTHTGDSRLHGEYITLHML